MTAENLFEQSFLQLASVAASHDGPGKSEQTIAVLSDTMTSIYVPHRSRTNLEESIRGHSGDALGIMFFSFPPWSLPGRSSQQFLAMRYLARVTSLSQTSF